MPSRFPQIARTWQPVDSTVRSGCTVRRTAPWRRASFQYHCSTTPAEVRNDVAGIAIDRLGVDGLGVEPFCSAGDHRVAAARSTEGQAVYPYANRPESR